MLWYIHPNDDVAYNCSGFPMLTIDCHADQNVLYWFSVKLSYPYTNLDI